MINLFGFIIDLQIMHKIVMRGYFFIFIEVGNKASGKNIATLCSRFALWQFRLPSVRLLRLFCFLASHAKVKFHRLITN